MFLNVEVDTESVAFFNSVKMLCYREHHNFRVPSKIDDLYNESESARKVDFREKGLRLRTSNRT